jgi:hypothetical protein
MTEEYIKVTGRMASNMEMVNFLPRRKEFGREVSGTTGNDSNGKIQQPLNKFFNYT